MIFVIITDSENGDDCGSLTPFVRSEQLVESSLAILVLDYQRSTWKTFVRVRVRFV